MDRDGDKVRRIRDALMSQSMPLGAVRAFELARDVHPAEDMRSVDRHYAAEFLTPWGEKHDQYERFIDSGMLDAINFMSKGGRLSDRQKAVLDARWKNHGTPSSQLLRELYERDSSVRWD